jgi:hypothetical protein
MEVEYSALSTGIRDVLSIKILETEISNNVGLTKDPITPFWTTVWEYNAGVLKLATLKAGGTTPPSKWYGIK